jgi:hypothetical protein
MCNGTQSQLHLGYIVAFPRLKGGPKKYILFGYGSQKLVRL